MLQVQVQSAFLLLTTTAESQVQPQLPFNPPAPPHTVMVWGGEGGVWVVSSPLFWLLHAVFTWSFLPPHLKFIICSPQTSSTDILICILHLIKSNLWDLWTGLMLTSWGFSQPQLSAAGSILQACFSEWHQPSLILKCAAFFDLFLLFFFSLDVDLKAKSTLGFLWEWKNTLAIDPSVCMVCWAYDFSLSLWFHFYQQSPCPSVPLLCLKPLMLSVVNGLASRFKSGNSRM